MFLFSKCASNKERLLFDLKVSADLLNIINDPS